MTAGLGVGTKRSVIGVIRRVGVGEKRFMNKLWVTAAEKQDDMALMHTILTAANKPAEFTPEAGILSRFDTTAKLRVLDFGCGMGRNTKWMVQNTAWEAWGYDSGVMLGRARKWLGPAASKMRLYSEWEGFKRQKFDIVFAFIVFQHIRLEELRGYLRDLTQITKKLVVWGRRYNDEKGANNWPIVQEFFDIKDLDGGEFRIDGDPHEHSGCIGIPRVK